MVIIGSCRHLVNIKQGVPNYQWHTKWWGATYYMGWGMSRSCTLSLEANQKLSLDPTKIFLMYLIIVLTNSYNHNKTPFSITRKIFSNHIPPVGEPLIKKAKPKQHFNNRLLVASKSISARCIHGAVSIQHHGAPPSITRNIIYKHNLCFRLHHLCFRPHLIHHNKIV